VIERNIERLLDYRERSGAGLPRVSFNMVLYPGVEEEEVREYVRRWGPYAETIMISRFRPVPSKRLLSPEERDSVKPHPCPLPFRQMVISWDGKVGLCCEDVFMDVLLGEVTKDSLLEIFNSRRYRRIRRIHERLEFEKIPLCRDCDVWAAEEVLREETLCIGGLNFRVFHRPSGRLFVRNAHPTP